MDEERNAAMDAALMQTLTDALSGVTHNAHTTTRSMKEWAEMIKAFSIEPGSLEEETFVIREEEELGNDWLVF